MATALWQELKACRGCGGINFKNVIDLGSQYVIDFPTQKDYKCLRAPLHAIRCISCGLVQLKQAVNKERLFSTMWYRSSISESMKSALEDVVRKVNTIVRLDPDDRVLDIGCNDGFTLGCYPSFVTTVGVDPCLELINEASKNRKADIAVHGFFSGKKLESMGPFKVITALAMFYDVPNPQEFLEDCRKLMTPDGLLVIQMNYLKTMLEENTVDNISHEHLTYWSLTSMKEITEAAGLQIQGVETNSVNGGSFRLYITQPNGGLYGIPVTKQMQLYGRMQALLLEEQKMGINSDEPYQKFRDRVGLIKDALRTYLINEKNTGERIYICGASTRGTALVQVLDLPSGVFEGAAERDEKKYDRYMVGCWAKIMPERDVRADATVMLVLPYHFAEQIKLREQQWLAMGGKLILPLPIPTIVKEGEEKIMRLGTTELITRQTEVVQ